jgi:cytochrome c oxidase subunit IV
MPSSYKEELEKHLVLFASGALVAAGFFGAFGAIIQNISSTGALNDLFDALRLTVYQVTFWAFLLSAGVTLATYVNDRRIRIALMTAGLIPSVVLMVLMLMAFVAHVFQWGAGFAVTFAFLGSSLAAAVLAGWGTGWAGYALMRESGFRIVRDEPASKKESQPILRLEGTEGPVEPIEETEPLSLGN